MFEIEQLEFLKQLVKNKVQFMIVGLSAPALQGAPVVTQSIDLWFDKVDTPGLKKSLRAVNGVYIPSIEMSPPMLGGKSVSLFDIVTHMSGIGSFQEERKNILEYDFDSVKVPVLKLERIIVSKKAANRKKDKLVLDVLEDALVTIKKRELDARIK